MQKINFDVKLGNVLDDTELFRIFSNFFPNIVSDLRISNLINNGQRKSNINSDPIATKIVHRHPNIINIM